MSSEGFFHRLLVPVDGSESSFKAARYAVRLACREGCEIKALHVVDEETANDMADYTERPVSAILNRMKRSGEGYLEDVEKIGKEAGVDVAGQIVVGIPYREVLDFAAKKDIDLIVMGTVGRKGPRRVLIGSVTERIIEHSSVPVLVVK